MTVLAWKASVVTDFNVKMSTNVPTKILVQNFQHVKIRTEDFPVNVTMVLLSQTETVLILTNARVKMNVTWLQTVQIWSEAIPANARTDSRETEEIVKISTNAIGRLKTELFCATHSGQITM